MALLPRVLFCGQAIAAHSVCHQDKFNRQIQSLIATRATHCDNGSTDRHGGADLDGAIDMAAARTVTSGPRYGFEHIRCVALPDVVLAPRDNWMVLDG
jgi:hypothetical protein